MIERAAPFQPQFYARTCGVLYLYIIVAGIFAETFVRSRLIVADDAARTMSNIAASEFTFRLGFSGELLHLAFDVAVAVLLYALLRPVDKYLALLAAFMRFACDLVLAVASLGHFVVLRVLKGGQWLDSFTTDQLNTLALFALKLHGNGYAISLVFFGFCCLALGCLIYRSAFLPRFLGVFMAIAGVCYLLNSFSGFLAPALAGMLFPALFLPIFIAELSLTLWLLIRGVNVAKWQAAHAQSA